MSRFSSPAYAAWTDAALFEALRTDDEGAFGELYGRYGYRLFAAAHGKLQSREVAEELVQDLFETLWRQRATAQVQQPGAYLFAALRYRIINYVKTRRLQAGYADYCRGAHAAHDESTEQQLALRDLDAAFRTSLDRLPEKSREVFQLSRLEHQSVPEISARLRLSEKAIEYHITKSLRLLRAYLQDFLLVLPLLLFLR